MHQGDIWALNILQKARYITNMSDHPWTIFYVLVEVKIEEVSDVDKINENYFQKYNKL